MALMIAGKSARPGGRPRLPKAEKDARGTTISTRLDPSEMPARPAAARRRTGLRPRHYAAIANAYAANVVAGRVVACKWVQLGCARHLRDLEVAKARASLYVWDPAYAAKACTFIEQLPHVEGTWATPTIRLEPAQIFLVAQLFGWRQRADPSLRRFTTLYWELGRKGAKSTLMAAIALFHLLEEGEIGPSVICGATTGSQARIVFGIAQQMIARSPQLRRRGVRSFVNAVCVIAPGTETTTGSMRPINAKASKGS